ncbi:hypothetical protein ES705_32132 [subsurface metagenome]
MKCRESTDLLIVQQPFFSLQRSQLSCILGDLHCAQVVFLFITYRKVINLDEAAFQFKPEGSIFPGTIFEAV